MLFNPKLYWIFALFVRLSLLPNRTSCTCFRIFQIQKQVTNNTLVGQGMVSGFLVRHNAGSSPVEGSKS